jgi:hypothetical protein
MELGKLINKYKGVSGTIFPFFFSFEILARQGV